MTNENKKTTSVKSNSEILKEVSARLEKKVEAQGATNSLIEAILIAGSEYAAVKTENENNKSVEQKNAEKIESVLRNKKRLLEKTKKEISNIDELLNKWVKRDTWLINKEALPLTFAKDPENISIFDTKDESLWGLVESCAGHSLQVINLLAHPKEWRVKPFEWVRWLKEKEIHVHPQLQKLLYPEENIAPTNKTIKATNSRERNKALRQKALKTFESKISELARQHNIVWSNEAIPVTKKEYLEIFYKLNPAIQHISNDSFNRDIADIGIKFKRGTKTNKNNVLMKLYKTM